MSITVVYNPDSKKHLEFIESLNNYNDSEYSNFSKRLEIIKSTDIERVSLITSRITPPINPSSSIRFILSSDPQLLKDARQQMPVLVTIYLYDKSTESHAKIYQPYLSHSIDLDNIDVRQLVQYLDRNSKDLELKNDNIYIIIGTYRSGALTFILNMEYLIETVFGLEMELSYLNHHNIKYITIGFPPGEKHEKYLNAIKDLADKMNFKLVKGYPTVGYNCDFPIQYPESYTVENITDNSNEYITKNSDQVLSEIEGELDSITNT